MEKKLANNNGITLVALIITIIVIHDAVGVRQETASKAFVPIPSAGFISLS